MAIAVPSVAGPPQAPAVTTNPASPDSARRWAAWQAKGAAHDRAVRRRMGIAAPLLATIGAIIIYALLGR